jgi:hypothetical protein
MSYLSLPLAMEVTGMAEKLTKKQIDQLAAEADPAQDSRLACPCRREDVLRFTSCFLR